MWNDLDGFMSETFQPKLCSKQHVPLCKDINTLHEQDQNSINAISNDLIWNKHQPLWVIH